MKLFLYEWKKLWKRKLVVVTFLILILLNIGFILHPYVNDFVNKDFRDASRYYTNKVSGKISQESFRMIESWNQKLEQKEMKAVSGNVEGDMIIFDLIKEVILQQIKYAGDMEEYTNKLQDNLRYFEAVDNWDSYYTNQLLIQTYQHRSLPVFENHEGWDKLVQYQKSTILLIMFVIVAIPPVWSKEREDDMVIMLLSTKKGRTGVNLAKILFTISLIVLSAFLFAMSELVVFAMLYGLHGEALPIYVQETYRLATMNVTNIGFWLSIWMYKLMSLLSIAMIALLLSKKVKSVLLSTLFTIGFVVLLLGLAEAGLLLWNPVSGFYLYQSVYSQTIYCVLSQAVYAYKIGLFASVLCIGLCFISLLYRERRS